MSGKVLHDAGKKLAMEKFKSWLERNVEDPRAINFMLSQFDAAYELILLSVENGGTITKGDVIKFMGSKAVGFSNLSESNRVACVSSLVSFGLAASAAPAAGASGPAGWVWYASTIMLEGLDVGGNCYLAYLDTETERKIKEFEAQIQARKMWGHANAKHAIISGQTMTSTLDAMLDWREKQPEVASCTARPALSLQ